MIDQRNLRTLVFVVDRDHILLGLKKRGFGAGKWNGFGGKVEEGETLVSAAARELHEEAGIIAHDLSHRGVLAFTFTTGLPPLWLHVFVTSAWEGEIQETEEMAPRWFPLAALPYEEMWVDDSHWVPLLVTNKHFVGRFHLADTETLLQWDVKSVALEELVRHI